MSSSREIPRATYRVQLHAGFTLDDAAKAIDYLADLGISHLYCSPYLQARAGSTHGYDVVDHRRISEELGGRSALERMTIALSERGMGHILDVVPNHMTIAEETNRWWREVLRNGPASQFAGYFDIEWDPPGEKLDRKVLVPVLGDHYGRVLEKGEIRLDVAEDEIVARYYEHSFPISGTSLEAIRGNDESLGSVAARINGDTDALDGLLEQQHYRLAYWKTAGQELNYRRFFAINDLVALRMENPAVFGHVHELVLSLVNDGKLQGLRVDHIDGLREPEPYLRRLRDEAPSAYLVVEKIIESDEELPQDWPVEGTTGYEFLNLVGGLFVDPAGEKPMTDLYVRFTGESADLNELTREKKILLMRTELATDLERLTDLFALVCERHRRHRDYTRNEMRWALAETIAAFPIYRTYVNARTGKVTEQDERWVREATDVARERRGDLEPEVFDFLAGILLLQIRGDAEDELAMRFQQMSGPVMAKGVEDTLFYTYNRFAALNDVGGDPGRFGISTDDFHRAMSRARASRPHSMLATSTHDTKRSEDVRARLSLLSEIPDAWADAVSRWFKLSESHRTGGLPDRNMEYLFFQTLVGTWPISIERTREYMAKASKEAKTHTSWISPVPHYDDALRAFVEGVMSDPELMSDIGSFAKGLVEPGWVTSLSQTLLKLTAPGVPDIYQGQELWDLSLVDPDNRRPVDYGLRRDLLETAEQATLEAAWADPDRGLPKMLVTTRALRLRRDRPAAFLGSYDPIVATGLRADHVIAFGRGSEVITVAPRLVLTLATSDGGWADTSVVLPPGSWRNVLDDDRYDGGRVTVGEVLAGPRVALLVRENGEA